MNNNYDILKNLEAKKRRVFHPYFTSQPHNIVSEYIKFFTQEGDIVLDPFVGSGVTLLECQILKRKSIGVDISPFACFIAEITNSKFENTKDLKEAFNNIKNDTYKEIENIYLSSNEELLILQSDYYYPRNINLPLNSDVNTVEELFTDRNLLALSALLNRINKEKDSVTKLFFRGVFSGILHRASKTFFNDKLNWGGGNSGIFTKYRYWIPQFPNEKNVWNLFETRFKRLLSVCLQNLLDNYRLKLRDSFYIFKFVI